MTRPTVAANRQQSRTSHSVSIHIDRYHPICEQMPSQILLSLNPLSTALLKTNINIIASTVAANRQQSRTLHSVSIHIDRYHPICEQMPSQILFSLDPLSTALLKTSINIVTPTLASIIHLSLESATVPSDIKHAQVTPLLETTGLDANYIKNYCPISNLSFVSKLLDKHVAADLRRYIDENKLVDPFQSAYRPHHST